MKLWRIWQIKNEGYDTYDSAVVAAETEEEARAMHPGYDKWDGKEAGTWPAIEHVSVELIGSAKDGTEPHVICASFNAG